METVRVEGVTYTKVAVLAKKFRYTTDYVGQLCRSGKVDCQFVGRTWYVSEESLLRHKDARYADTRAAEKTSKVMVESSSNEPAVAVSPRLKNVTAKQMRTASTPESASHFLTRLESPNSKYYTDETELLPQPLKRTPQSRIEPTQPAAVPVAPTDAVSVRVTTTTKPKKLSFTDVPAVALRGHLTVQEVAVEGDSEVVTAAAIAELVPEDTLDTVPLGQKRQKPQTIAENAHAAGDFDPEAPRVTRQTTARSFTPQRVAVATATPSRLPLLLSVAVVAASVFAGFFVSAFQVFMIEGTEVSASIMFSFEALLQLL